MMAAWLIALALVAPQATVEPQGTDSVEWHLVKPGDTLEGLTAQYLGSSRFWRDNWRLNPDLKDPHRLLPGQRIRIIVKRTPTARQAEIRLVERQVDKKPEPQPWTPARAGDLLRERDGLRTMVRSSAQLAFDDGAQVLITEQSIVFLRELSAALSGARKQSVEIIEGQADLAARAPPKGKASDIEIVVGGALARPRAEADQPLATRARRGASSAQLMVYAGRSDFEAGGARVAVAQGMGSAARDGERPSRPEKLLSAPAPLRPEPAASFDYANPRFTWAPVSGAASYTVEIFRDAEATRLVERAPGLTGLDWLPGALPRADLYWRVTATSASGLDGYASVPRALSVRSEDVDREAPAAVVLIDGRGTALARDAVTLGAGGQLRLEAHDDVSGVAEVRFRWDAGAWTVAAGRPQRPPSPGPHVLEFQAFDRIGRASPVFRLSVQQEGAP
jgi:hypothetical protein